MNEYWMKIMYFSSNFVMSYTVMYFLLVDLVVYNGLYSHGVPRGGILTASHFREAVVKSVRVNALACLLSIDIN